MVTSNDLADHIASLTPSEFSQVDDIATYLAEKAGKGNPSGKLPERSLGNFLNSQSPRIRQTFKGLQEVISTPRQLPFQSKRSEVENMTHLGIDPDSGSTIMSALDYADVQQGVMDKMGTDSDLPPSEPTTRDIISAAIDHHAGEE